MALVKITVESEKCQGHALCYGVDPDVFPLDESGYTAIRGSVTVDVEPEIAERAAGVCPERIITWTE